MSRSTVEVILLKQEEGRFSVVSRGDFMARHLSDTAQDVQD
jgi:hypothetical protein